MDKTTISRISRQFLRTPKRRQGCQRNRGTAQSYVVSVDKDKNEIVYISQLSSSTCGGAGLPDGLAEDAGGRAK